MFEFALVFDMDGVIIDSNPFHKVALKKFCAKYGFSLDEKQLREKIYGRTNKDWIRNLFGEISSSQLKSYAQEKEELYREIYKHDIQALTGLSKFLKEAKQAGVPMAIGTSAPIENVHFTLEATQLEEYFPIIRDESHVEKGKPDPDIYLKVSEALGLPPQKCLVFEDSLAGVESAIRANCPVIGVSTTHSPEELSNCQMVISDFNEINLSIIQKTLKLD